MKYRRHDPHIPLAFECALLFLAFAVFGWGLQAKVSSYFGDAGATTSTRSMAKLATEESSARTVAAVKHQDESRLAGESLHFAAAALVQQGKDVPAVYLSYPRPVRRVSGRYGLHEPYFMRRPPPALS